MKKKNEKSEIEDSNSSEIDNPCATQKTKKTDRGNQLRLADHIILKN